MTILEHHQTVFILICPLVLGLHNDGNITPQFTDVTQPFYSCYFKSSKYRAYQCSKSMKNMIFQELYCKEYISNIYIKLPFTITGILYLKIETISILMLICVTKHNAQKCERSNGTDLKNFYCCIKLS